jgi:hemolysin III
MTAAELVATPQSGFARPRLRGWLHVWAFAVSIVTGAVLVAVTAAAHGPRAVLATSVYACAVSLLFGTSALYHRVAWSPARHTLMARLDHSMIFLLIAGTYTPFALLVLPTPTGDTVLTVVWAGAVGGIGLKAVWIEAPRQLTVPLYLALGWMAVAVFPDLLRNGGVAAFVLLLAGGLMYSAGALVYASRRPDPMPHVFGFHEVFHLCTVVAALCHYLAVWLAVYSG